ncbi:DUF4435 domain-containing protein [Alcaligenaceae bacterium]|nr:DUF4435 domain-containing protein [Alcaligenaceae bacterium]
MGRIDALRAARNVPHVAFSEYLKLKSKSNNGPILIFEGKQCPAYYINKVVAIIGSPAAGQLIARGKAKVLELRDIILRNLSTADDLVLYFIDRDYDDYPALNEGHDVYVTRGYSIENEFFKWPVVEGFLRANFDIADAADHEALRLIEELFFTASLMYLDATAPLHKTVYVCRRNKIRCLPGDSAVDYISIDWQTPSITLNLDDANLLGSLNIHHDELPNVTKLLAQAGTFDTLDRDMDWRGKYHFSFLRALLIFLAEGRVKGTWPFSRAAKYNVDPSHSGLISHLSSFTQAPPCLESFLRAAMK